MIFLIVRLVIVINNRIMERLVAKMINTMLTVAKLLSDVNKPVSGAFMPSFSEGGFNVSLLFSSLLSSLFGGISFRIDNGNVRENIPRFFLHVIVCEKNLPGSPEDMNDQLFPLLTGR